MIGFGREFSASFLTVLVLIGSNILTPPASAQEPERPFPQHSKYAPGTLRPNHVSQKQQDDAVRAYYDFWKAKYLVKYGSDQYYIQAQVWQPGAVSVSEGTGYGMLIVAFMAGHDPQARTIFDGLFTFARNFPTNNSPYLMSWYQKKGSNGKLINAGQWSATDADLDIAYALLLADKQWGSAGEINYLARAKETIQALMKHNVNRTHWNILRGSTGQSDQDTRSSDFMLGHFRSFEAATGDKNWGKVLEKCVSTLQLMQKNHSPGTGLIPDFLVNSGSTPVPSPPNKFEGARDGHYFYNACRVPLRLAADYALSGDTRLSTIVGKINSFIKTKTGGSPSKIQAGYYLNGGVIWQHNQLAFRAPLAAGAMIGNSNQSWLNSCYTHIVAFKSNGYFDDNLKMLSLIVLSGNWWRPEDSTVPVLPPPVGKGTGLRGRYYDQKNFSQGKLDRVDASVNFNWGKGSPHSSIGPDTFSIRWTGSVEASYSETYTFYVQSDDGVRLWVDGKLLINNWSDHAMEEDTATVSLTAGKPVEIRLDYYENGGLAVARLLWSSSSTPKEVIPSTQLYPAQSLGEGLTGQYFDNRTFTKLKHTRIDPTISFDWKAGSPHPSIKKNTFSIRWTGEIEAPVGGTYTFYTSSDDGVRLWVNGVLLIKNWTDHPKTENFGKISLAAGQKYKIRLDYYERKGLAVIQLRWSGPGRPKEIVPASFLFPAP